MRKYFVFEELKIDEKIFENRKMETVENINMNNVGIKSVSSLVHAFPNAKVVLISKLVFIQIKIILKL